MSAQPTEPTAEELQEEERLEDALEHLKILHLQVSSQQKFYFLVNIFLY